MLQLTWKFVHVDIELESNRLEFKHLEIESIGLDLVLLKQLGNCLVLPFIFLLSPNVVPLSTSKPQKPMNKSNPKQKIKPILQRVLLLHWSGGEKQCVRSDFHCLSLVIGEKLPGFGNRRLGCWVFASLLLSSTGATARNHTSDPISIA